MTRSVATIVTTTAVPMRGYEEALLVAGGCSTHLHDLSHALQSRLRLGEHEADEAGDFVTVQGCGRQYQRVKEFQAPEIRCLAGLPDWKPTLGSRVARFFECGDRDFFGAVRSAYLSYFLASVKAWAKGDLTRPVVLHGHTGVIEKIDLLLGSYFTRCVISSPEQDHLGAVDVFISCRSALDVRAFLEEVYDLGQRDLQAATDTVFDTIDRLLCEGRFEACDQILTTVEVARLPTALMRSFLTITAAAKDKLSARQEFYKKVEREMSRLRGPDVTRRLLSNLA